MSRFTLLLRRIFFVVVFIVGMTFTRADDVEKFWLDTPPPAAAIVFSGFLNGYVEPCGCAGLDRMKGGLGRRHTFFEQLRERGWNLIPIDAGNLNKGASPLEEQKFQFVIEEAMRLMQYQAVGMGDRELLFPPTTLLLYTADTVGNPKRYTSANVALFDFDPTILAPYRIATSGGVRVGVVSALGKSLQQNITAADEVVFVDPLVPVRNAVAQLKKVPCDFIALIFHGSTSERDALLAEFPNNTFSFVIPSETPAEPPLEPQKLPCGAWLIEVGLKGSYVVVAEIGSDKSLSAIKFHRVALDGRFTMSPGVLAAMQSYQDYLKDVGWEGLGLRPTPSPQADKNGKFVGSASCRNCHEKSFDVWKTSSHASALRALVDVSKPARQYDPECIACHVVGWNPSDATPYTSGFVSQQKTPLLADVGCESCHGPGEVHVAAETNGSAAAKNTARLDVRLTLEGARHHCTQCHDHENSPAFNFDTYWDKVKHKEVP
ncbi:MAG: multiheme c-type cytochrome [Thermoguttaceae bacterium]